MSCFFIQNTQQKILYHSKISFVKKNLLFFNKISFLNKTLLLTFTILPIVFNPGICYNEINLRKEGTVR